jgi:hypothetical protein
VNELRLHEIWIYPVKSLAGIRVNRAKVLEKGLEYDRRMMLVDEQGLFITQRNQPRLTLFRTRLENDILKISHPSGGEVQVSMNPRSLTTEPVTIWNDVVNVSEPDTALSRWFSNLLGISCRLVFFPEAQKRPVDPNFAVQGEQVSLADGYPYVVIGQSSLEDLNKRLPNPVTMQRFRPNFVVTGSDPYAEDEWVNVRMGSAVFKGVKNCGRCVLITVHPDTGVKGEEPLKTLTTYRRRNQKIYFGQNLVALQSGEISEGDILYLDS